MNCYPMVVQTGAPRKVIVNNGVVVRYGFVDLGTGFSKCVERLFLRMPKQDKLKGIIEQYNTSNGVDDAFNPADYGYAEE